ncbi:hypothetical protein HK102_004711, partial [Quaeritorhiza haematococci]
MRILPPPLPPKCSQYAPPPPRSTSPQLPIGIPRSAINAEEWDKGSRMQVATEPHKPFKEVLSRWQYENRNTLEPKRTVPVPIVEVSRCDHGRRRSEQDEETTGKVESTLLGLAQVYETPDASDDTLSPPENENGTRNDSEVTETDHQHHAQFGGLVLLQKQESDPKSQKEAVHPDPFATKGPATNLDNIASYIRNDPPPSLLTARKILVHRIEIPKSKGNGHLPTSASVVPASVSAAPQSPPSSADVSPQRRPPLPPKPKKRPPLSKTQTQPQTETQELEQEQIPSQPESARTSLTGSTLSTRSSDVNPPLIPTTSSQQPTDKPTALDLLSQVIIDAEACMEEFQISRTSTLSGSKRASQGGSGSEGGAGAHVHVAECIKQETQTQKGGVRRPLPPPPLPVSLKQAEKARNIVTGDRDVGNELLGEYEVNRPRRPCPPPPPPPPILKRNVSEQQTVLVGRVSSPHEEDVDGESYECRASLTSLAGSEGAGNPISLSQTSETVTISEDSASETANSQTYFPPFERAVDEPSTTHPPAHILFLRSTEGIFEDLEKMVTIEIPAYLQTCSPENFESVSQPNTVDMISEHTILNSAGYGGHTITGANEDRVRLSNPPTEEPSISNTLTATTSTAPANSPRKLPPPPPLPPKPRSKQHRPQSETSTPPKLHVPPPPSTPPPHYTPNQPHARTSTAIHQQAPNRRRLSRTSSLPSEIELRSTPVSMRKERKSTPSSPRPSEFSSHRLSETVQRAGQRENQRRLSVPGPRPSGNYVHATSGNINKK